MSASISRGTTGIFLNPDKYTVAWIAVLPIEAEAALGMLDQRHDGQFESYRGDDYIYTGGEINGHNVIVGTLPVGQNYGIAPAAALANQLKARFPNIWFALLVGIAAGLPNLSPTDPTQQRDIRLGDVLVSVPYKSSPGIVGYDMGEDTDEKFVIHARLAETPGIVRSAFGRIRLCKEDLFKRGTKLATYLDALQQTDRNDRFRCPSQREDELFTRSNDPTAPSKLTTREPRDESERTRVWYGSIGSSNSLMKNSRRRDALRDEYNLIGLEMEAAGVMDTFPTGVIRGVSDYGDSQKNKDWQPYAAAVAAAYAKGVLCSIGPKAVQTPRVNAPQTFPFPRNEDVVIRETIFLELNRMLPFTSRYQSAVLWGLGGSGKTQIALELAYRRHAEFQTPVFWVHANNYEKFFNGYEKIAVVARLSPELQGDEMMAAVRSWLETQQTWLLILDNADDLRHFGLNPDQQREDKFQNLRSYIPRGSYGSILWTTRDKRAVGHLAGLQRGLEIGSMTDAEAETLLTQINVPGLASENQGVVEQVLERLDRLPLAVSQAASYMRETSTTIEEYCAKLNNEKKRWRLLQTEGPSRHRQDDVPNSVIHTWSITMQYLNQENPLAHRLLLIIGFFNHQNIPLSIIRAAAKAKFEDVSSTSIEGEAKDLLKLGQTSETISVGSEDSEDEDERLLIAVTRLTHFSFLKLRTSPTKSRSYDLHSLVQDATRYAVTHGSKSGNRRRISATALDILLEMFPSGDFGTWDQCALLLSHALTVCECQELVHEKLKIAELLGRVSIYLTQQGRSNENEKIQIKALHFLKEALGEKHPRTLDGMFGLAITYEQQGRSKEAEKLKTEVVQLQRALLGAKHPATISSMTSLAATYQQQGRYNEAEQIFVENLPLQKETNGTTHPDVIEMMAKLAIIIDHQGRSDEAEKLKTQVLQLRKETVGERHPDTLHSMANLAATYFRQGRLDEAREIHVKVLQLRRDVLGDKHPDTIRSMIDVTVTFTPDQIDQEEQIQTEVLQLRKELLGNKHPDTLESMTCLAVTYCSQGRPDQAEDMFTTVLQLRKEVLGEKHPKTIESMLDLASVYYVQDRLSEDEAITTNVLQLRREVLGEKHPDTIATMASLGTTYHQQNRLEEAKGMLIKTLELRKEILGDEHPNTISSVTRLAECCEAMELASSGDTS